MVIPLMSTLYITFVHYGNKPDFIGLHWKVTQTIAISKKKKHFRYYFHLESSKLLKRAPYFFYVLYVYHTYIAKKKPLEVACK